MKNEFFEKMKDETQKAQNAVKKFEVQQKN